MTKLFIYAMYVNNYVWKTVVLSFLGFATFHESILPMTRPSERGPRKGSKVIERFSHGESKDNSKTVKLLEVRVQFIGIYIAFSLKIVFYLVNVADLPLEFFFTGGQKTIAMYLEKFVLLFLSSRRSYNCDLFQVRKECKVFFIQQIYTLYH